jgi:hypothetical protein
MKASNQEPQIRLKNLAVLFAFITVAVFFGLYVSPHDTYIRWGGLVITIAVIFGGLIRESRRFHGMTSFWMLATIFVSLNLVIFGVILTHVREWRLPWFGVMLIEIPIFITLRDGLQSK